jgi:N4-gp56 family major capsid protein
MWTFDAPSGVYKNHALSSRIRTEAAADAQFMRFLRAESGYGKGRGESVTITRILQLPLAGKVSETDRLPTGRPAINTKSVSVSEWGFTIEMTEFEKNLTHFDITNPFQQMLRDQMRLTMDKMAADAIRATPIKFVPLAAGSAITTNGSPNGTADVNLRITDLREIHDFLRGDLKAPPFRNGQYVGILSTKAARGIKNDSEYKDWQAPTTAQPFITGRLRSVEGFDLYETNHFDALANAIGGSGVLGEALFFGQDHGFLATVQEPELRAELPTNLGRFREVGWVGTIEAGLTWDLASHSRVVHVTSE